jgi:hypothetical protein
MNTIKQAAQMNYPNSLDALNPDWPTEAIKLMEMKIEFALVHYDGAIRDDCIALARKHDYRVVEGPNDDQVGFKLKGSIRPTI